jgi:putative transposase
MPRQLRVLLPGVAAHVVQRAADRRVCFRGDNDFILYLLHLRDLVVKHGTQLHAYCLMSNHVHLLLSPSCSESCQTMMKELAQRYSQYFNRTYARSGPLWTGRYYSCIAESAVYVLACYRYIEMNPVRAGIVGHPAEYKWSSYLANAEGVDDRLTSPHQELIALGDGQAARQHAYKNLFGEALEPPLLVRIRESTLGGYPLASEEFKAQIAAKFGTKLEPSRPGPRPAAPLCSVPDPDLF